MNRKNKYKNKEKWKETCNSQRRKYYKKTAYAINHRKKWNEEEIKIIMEHKICDRDISKLLGRSMNAIQVKRAKEIKRKLENDT